MSERHEHERKGHSIFGWLIWTSLVFIGGFSVGNFSPPIEQLASEHLGLDLGALGAERPTAEPVSTPTAVRRLTPADEARHLLARIGEYVAAINSKIERQQANLKENQTSTNILRSQGEPESSTVFSELAREQARIEDRLTVLGQALDEALTREAEIQRLVHATADIEAGYVDDGGVVLDTEALLARLEMLGLEPVK